MNTLLDKLPHVLRKKLAVCAHLARQRKQRVYVVGGIVRDLLMDRENLDVDIVVEGDGLDFASRLAQKTKADLRRHRLFQTATLLWPDQCKIDVATARRELYPNPGHLPVVSRGSIEEDLTRRDFTINAMAISLDTGGRGHLLDLYGGLGDLKAGRVRILHDKSFWDDPTRILRAIRFEQRFNFKMEAHTLWLLQAASRGGALLLVKGPRLKGEMKLILQEPHPFKYIRRLYILAGFSFISPGLRLTSTLKTWIRATEDVLSWFKEEFSGRRQPQAWLLYLGVLLSSLSSASLEKLFRDWSFSRGERIILGSLRGQRQKVTSRLSAGRIRPSSIYRLLEPLSYEAILGIFSSTTHKRVHDRIRDFFLFYNGRRYTLSTEELQRRGLSPGPEFGRVLNQLLFARLDGRIKDKEEEGRFLERILSKIHESRRFETGAFSVR